MGADSFIPVYDWMLDLPIHGSEILLYAIIHSFSSSAGSFTGSQQYLARRAKLTRQSVNSILRQLEEKQLVLKTDYMKDNVKYCVYRVNAQFLPKEGMSESDHPCKETGQGDVKKPDIPCKETGQGDVKKPDTPCKETGHNKKEYNKEDNKEDKKERGEAPSRHASVRKAYGDYHNVLLSDEELMELKRDFPADYRERIGRLSDYMASTGKHYKNHSATIRVWAKRDERERKTSAPAAERQQQMAEVLKMMEKKGLTL